MLLDCVFSAYRVLAGRAGTRSNVVFYTALSNWSSNLLGFFTYCRVSASRAYLAVFYTLYSCPVPSQRAWNWKTIRYIEWMNGCILYLLCFFFWGSCISAEQISRMSLSLYLFLSFFITVIIYMRQFFNHSTAACGMWSAASEARPGAHYQSCDVASQIPPFGCSIVNRVVTFVTQLKVVYCAGISSMQHTHAHTPATLINIERLHSRLLSAGKQLKLPPHSELPH